VCNVENKITCWNSTITHLSSFITIHIITKHETVWYGFWDPTFAVIPNKHCTSQLIHFYHWHKRTTCRRQCWIPWESLLILLFPVRERHFDAISHQRCPTHLICFNNCTSSKLGILCYTTQHRNIFPFGDTSLPCRLHTWIKGTPLLMLLQLWIIIHCNRNISITIGNVEVSEHFRQHSASWWVLQSMSLKGCWQMWQSNIAPQGNKWK
jgi:hypothetical protein